MNLQKLNNDVTLALGWDPIDEIDYTTDYTQLEELLRYITSYYTCYKIERLGKDCWGTSVAAGLIFTAPTLLQAVCKLVVACSKGRVYAG